MSQYYALVAPSVNVSATKLTTNRIDMQQTSTASSSIKAANLTGSAVLETFVTNNTTAILYVAFGEGTFSASSTAYDIIVPANSVVSFPGTNRGIAACFSATGSGKATFTEFVAT